MASKRSRATFEADLQAQQSPFVVYGTPLPPLDESIRDDGSYVPIWKQQVTDEQGRKRLHGAFTGGFSAGYFNTVGSKDGWTPSTFVSSRTNRKKDAAPAQQRPEDFMDDEDLAEADEARKLENVDIFAGLGSVVDGGPNKEPFMDLVKFTGETMGVKLLKRMGWREGQGIGPKVMRKAKLEEDELSGGVDEQQLNPEMHLFAPENSKMISYVRKKDRKGLGYDRGEGFTKPDTSAEGSESVRTLSLEENEDGGPETLKDLRDTTKKKKKLARRGGIGIGILNDTGSDEEDPYSMGPSISYNRVVAGDKKKKKRLEPGISSANPLLSSKPVFMSKKGAAKGDSIFRRCHDGRLPLDGFTLSGHPDLRSSNVPQDGEFLPPKIPEGWRSSKASSSNAKTSVHNEYQSTAQVTAAAKLSPKSRAALLGEMQLPGKSVFDYLNPAARNRIVSATHNPNLPPALSEADTKSSGGPIKTLASLVPQLARETALTALGRGTAGWMPYAEDTGKRARYRTFLEIRAALRPESTLPERAPGASNDDWVTEMKEFAHAAEIFKPMSGAMASRFTSSSAAPRLASDNAKDERATGMIESSPLISQPTAKAKTPAEEAAAVGLYGPLTRSVENFYPSRLLCKRFNVKPPSHVQMDSSHDASNGQVERESRDSNGPPPTHSTALPQRRLELVGKEEMDELRISGGGMLQSNRALFGAEQTEAAQIEGLEVRPSVLVVDPERNEALETERPGEAVFKAIFGSDSEDD